LNAGFSKWAKKENGGLLSISMATEDYIKRYKEYLKHLQEENHKMTWHDAFKGSQQQEKLCNTLPKVAILH
jgi:hypothetical protein